MIARTESVDGSVPAATTLLRRSRSVMMPLGSLFSQTTTLEMFFSRMVLTASTSASSGPQVTTARWQKSFTGRKN
ncbi:MAG: hypothetical protein AW09_004288 [Candidatus Accumulibacter phosphatis]|uniref:Uncharacterized protein n=1 Tax=Candidatus Accumulibacter phosphatis TaxID=327160 RepID=A0A080LR31_9PROT|nr:MAG: hypothetical protein AW09_004288 [Candidatus Accumulibacter phosphatis]